MKFGYEGIGLFYTALEKIAKQEKPIKTDVLKVQLKVGKRLEKCWNFMEQIGILSSKNGETFNEQLLNFSEKYQIKKQKTRERVAEWREKQQDINNVTCYERVSNACKVKENKVKENKVNNITQDEPVKNDFMNDLLLQFQESYEEVNGEKYDIVNIGKERTAISKLLIVYKNKNPDHDSKQTVEGFRQFFDLCNRVNDDWMQKNMSPTLIMSKLNEIKTTIRNGSKRTNSKGGATDREITELFARKLGIEQ